MIYSLITFLAIANFATGHIITSGKFENRVSSPETKVNLGQAQIEVENELTKKKLIDTPVEIQSTIQTSKNIPYFIQADKSEFNAADLKTLPVNDLNLLTPAQIQACRTKFNVANLQGYGKQEKYVNPLYWTSKYARFAVKPFLEVYTFPVSAHSSNIIGFNLASSRLNFKVGELTSIDQSGKF
ncbi:hypothetical protein CONCODRAFT_68946 [Conidiobolus coronatus NRRL 28638]|uniref:Uncharacterized protein n=1 Tax=Conidiobolus coronatus (strain ATCC 28846 / CBS 209.66 / NRRL 28638) TaxID=796925 RepID=A0A137PC78_CONC2|nr:hypothetical protein CONCODRAFT_68946 [Conidiobolus coronatus NRRL 28638]|eukprot:KXN72541.1 hypothetical protein CONCODRAFT_68946 [Conidiobolus coronatus NRRL 28638]